MSDIKERIEKINPYFQKMEVVSDTEGSVIYVSVVFPKNWAIADDISEKYNVTVRRDSSNQGAYYFCAEMETGFESVFDAIDYNIAKMKAAIERVTLLTEKINELKTLFEDENIPLEILRTIDFKRYSLKSMDIDSVSDSEETKEIKNKRDKKV